LTDTPSDVLVMGNLDPVGVFRQSTPEEVYQQTSALLKSTVAYSNFILSSGCDVPANVPQSNIASFYAALRDYNRAVE
jgi:uroporphyrinogen decarboxylase